MTETDMVHEQIDTIDALMAHYVAGSLPEPARVLVQAHLEMKPDNRSLVNSLELLAGEALESVQQASIADRDRRLAAIFASDSPIMEPAAIERPEHALFPQALRDFVGFEAEDVPWRTRLPGFKEYPLDMDGCEVNLMWIRPGRALPAHTHKGMELILILDGAFNDERGRFGPGDISIADETVDHRPVAEKDRPCIAFAVSDGPVRLTGSFRQMIGDLIG
ncbi:putative transcriptional regulator [Rhizobium leguminosarum]|uniref:Transcriptional regulator n=1 Tax=Rhizobium leguminosarum TaxID=384 RepID=A0AAE2MJU6_RHILE|nr:MULTISPECIES: ChrR family anti-sigma-E factor [Rhizobium]MBB4290708.1 putative transcriptional regulator [Rhizobium leguminosarum]MBB4297412.1 putative transcriptional regulator [Rhizobium leguminosarum]MBB4307388.1 putative transcriptional regulator [Rhizobium leguminosarum]MBB4415162.1 putative transcriptional regulator [Rhizobium leguminosarum]MBB4431871.1 putative transcriptional regulator [Rhizobium esperanzae]